MHWLLIAGINGGRVIFEILRYDEGFMKHILFSIVILQNNSLRGK